MPNPETKQEIADETCIVYVNDDVKINGSYESTLDYGKKINTKEKQVSLVIAQCIFPTRFHRRHRMVK